MELNKYQESLNNLNPVIDKAEKIRLLYYALGVCGEAGEVAEEIKKCVRDDDGRVSFKRKEDIILEVGDVFYYLAQLAKTLNLTFEEIAEASLEKFEKKAWKQQQKQKEKI